MYPEVTTAIEAWLQNPDIHRLDDPQLLENGQLKSGSNWTWQHVNAFRIVPLLDVALQDVLPAQYFPSCEESIMQQCQAFWVM
jgi:hypothetical protein